MMRDTTKLIAIGPATPMFVKSQIQVYSPSGEGLLLFGVRIHRRFALLKLSFRPPPHSSGTRPRSFALAGQVMSDWWL
jgi:hypothetical protein